MPRSARVVIDGGTYHIWARGNNGQTLFHHDHDYQRYLHLLSRYAAAHHLTLYHFVLMPNHVHLVLEVRAGDGLSRAMRGLNLSYSLYYRKRHQYHGHLWQERFKSFQIDRDSYLLDCGRHVELNPVRTGLVQDPGAYAWSSYRAYAHGVDDAPLGPHPLYERLGPTAQERQERYRRFVHHRLTAETRNSTSHPEDRFGFPAARRRRGRPKKLLHYPPVESAHQPSSR